jgi:MFS family permease
MTVSPFRFRLEARAALPALVLMTVTFTYAAVLGYLPPFVRARGLGSEYGAFYVAYGLTLLLTRGVWGRIYDRQGRSWVLWPGLAALAFAMVLLPLIRSLAELIGFGILYALGFGAVQPATLTWTAERVPWDRLGQGIATYYTAFDGGMALAYSGVGVAIAHVGYRIAFWLTAALVAVGAGIWQLGQWRANRGENSPEARPF